MKEQIINDFMALPQILTSVMMLLVIGLCLFSLWKLFKVIDEWIRKGCLDVQESKPAYFFRNQSKNERQRVILFNKGSIDFAKKFAADHPYWTFVLLKEDSIADSVPEENWTSCRNFEKQE